MSGKKELLSDDHQGYKNSMLEDSAIAPPSASFKQTKYEENKVSKKSSGFAEGYEIPQFEEAAENFLVNYQMGSIDIRTKPPAGHYSSQINDNTLNFTNLSLD